MQHGGLFAEPDHDVFFDRHVGEQQRLLRHHINAPRQRCGGAAQRCLFTGDKKLAAVRLVDPHNNFHQCAFARAVAANQSDHVAGAHVQVNALKHRVQAEGLGDPAYRQQSAGG
ncbi:hypothetical protein SDC9_193683 [bioreactor metagenome]|uniref:Uncharacterized protein n=1 Tax=bioreactor metagenome TaxID=1076179 RepID=A0A645IFF6_9ZZZZ